MTGPVAAPEQDEPEKSERIAKVIARAGVCSRREAERLIAEGRVALDGQRLDSPAVNVTAAQRITIDGELLPSPEPARLWRYHKPAGLITSTQDPQGRPTVFKALPPELGRLLSVGRLDLNSEGLLLLTNDGALKRRLELPANGWTRRYRVRVYGRVDPKKLAGLARGIRVAGVDYGPIRAELERQTGSNAWLKMALTEGKNREVRKVLEHLGLSVNRLIRIAYGPFQLGHLGRGDIEQVSAKVLAEQLGLSGGGRKIGTAKAKPRPPKPGGKRPGGKRPGPSKGKSKGKRRAGTAGKDAAKNAHRRRPA